MVYGTAASSLLSGVRAAQAAPNAMRARPTTTKMGAGLGVVFGSLISGAARNPNIAKQLLVGNARLVGCALTESIALVSLVLVSLVTLVSLLLWLLIFMILVYSLMVAVGGSDATPQQPQALPQEPKFQAIRNPKP
jgi:F0F1-type ATP synthase membrane subunit c/vacuolar-type H+-ATPase subunit K